MHSQVAVEALYSATYVENYLDSVENLPDDVQRHLSRIRDIDVQYRSHLRDVDYHCEQWKTTSASASDTTAAKRARAMARIQQNLIAAQELGDEKLQIVNQLQELIDHKTRQLDLDFKNLDYGKEEQSPESAQKIPRPNSPTAATTPVNIKVENQVFPVIQQQAQRGNTPTNQTTERIIHSGSTERSNKRSRRPRNDVAGGGGGGMDVVMTEVNPTSDINQKQGQTNQAASSSAQKKNSNSGGGKKKKRKARGQNNNNQTNARDARDETPPPEEAIDPDEPTYCLCDQISFGEMILCDNDLCPIEWFHFSCVALQSKPKGKWFCPNCRGDRSNVMKPKAQFLKELERYNREKEEKT